MSKPGADPTSGISLGDALRLPKRHPACRRREAQPGSRKKRTCSGHATNSRRYRDLGSTCLCRGCEWLDLNGVAKVGQETHLLRPCHKLPAVPRSRFDMFMPWL